MRDELSIDVCMQTDEYFDFKMNGMVVVVALEFCSCEWPGGLGVRSIFGVAHFTNKIVGDIENNSK